MQDLRLAIRALRATPVVTSVAILSLALGIGANTAIFSLVNSLILRSLPVRDAQRLALVVGGSVGLNNRFSFSYSTLDQIRQHGEALDGVFAYNCCGKATLTVGGEHQTVDRMWVSGDFFATLGVQALVGRTITPADDVVGGGRNGPVVVISYALWQQRFGGATSVIGTPTTIERIPVTIVGVAPPEFFGVEVGRTVDLMLPIRTEPLILPAIPFGDDVPFLAILLRLKPGQSLATAATALRAVQPQIRTGSMPSDPGTRPADFLKAPFTLAPAGEGLSTLRQQFQRPLVAVFVVVVFVLLIASANIANLMFARGAARRYELTMRLALGASRWQLVRLLLMESLVIGTIGSSLAFVIAGWASRAVVAQLSTSPTRVVLDLSPDWRVAVFAAVTLIATTTLFGVAPAIRATCVVPNDVLKEHGRTGGDRSYVPQALVVTQIALSLVLIVAAGLFTRTFERLARVSLGFDSDRILVVTVTAPTVAAADRNPFYHQLVHAVATAPGVARAGGALSPPPLYPPMQDQVFVTVPGGGLRPDAERIARLESVTPGWLATLGISLRAGRDIDEHDTTASPPVMVVNEAFLRRFFPAGGALGARVALTVRFGLDADVPIGSWTLIGIASDAVFASIREPVPPTMYLALAQVRDPIRVTSFYMIARPSAGSPLLLTRGVAAALAAVNRDLTVTFRPLADQVSTSLAQDQLVAWMSGFFGALAVLLAALGLYGVTAYAVARRRAEIGIRMALGAAPAGVIRLVLSRVVVLIGLGVAIGAGVSLWASKFVASLLYGLEPRDPATLIGAAVTLAAVGAVAGWLPAWRASRIDPAEVLRES